jgi:hypothetical protein
MYIQRYFDKKEIYLKNWLKRYKDKNIFQILRFISHYHGAYLLASSIHDTSLKESFRGIFNSIVFRAPIKPMHETAADKLIFVSPGQDSFEAIVQASKASKSEGSFGKVFEFEQCLDSNGGVKKDCWAK